MDLTFVTTVLSVLCTGNDLFDNASEALGEKRVVIWSAVLDLPGLSCATFSRIRLYTVRSRFASGILCTASSCEGGSSSCTVSLKIIKFMLNKINL